MTTPYTGNTKYGSGALKFNNTDGGNNSAFGVDALSISTEKWNTAVGAYSGLATTSGISNTSVGTNTLLKNTSGNYNTALGTAALCRNTGSGNTAVGSNSIEFKTTGENNTIIGTETGKSIVTGSNNICLGYKAGTSGSSVVDYSNCILIGNNVYPIASNQAIIGDGTQTSMNLVCSQNPTMSGYAVPAPSDNTNNIATCKWVQDAIINGGGGGSSLLTSPNNWSGINTFNNLVYVNTAVSGTQTSFAIKDTVTSRSIQFAPQMGGGLYSNLIQSGDSVIFGYRSSQPDVSTLTVTTHSTTNSGMRLTPTSAMIGAGGTTLTPTSSILFSGTTAVMKGILQIDSIIQAPSTLIGNSTINAAGNNNIFSYMSGNVNAYINNATSGIISFSTNDSLNTPKNALQITALSLTTEITPPPPTDSSSKIPTTEWVQSAMLPVYTLFSTGGTFSISTFCMNNIYQGNSGLGKSFTFISFVLYQTFTFIRPQINLANAFSFRWDTGSLNFRVLLLNDTLATFNSSSSPSLTFTYEYAGVAQKIRSVYMVIPTTVVGFSFDLIEIS